MFAGSGLARTQQVVALSSTEAEYMAIGECVKELLFLNNVLSFVQPLNGVEENTMEVYEDNTGAINLAENPSNSARSKYIDVQHHFLRCQAERLRLYPLPPIHSMQIPLQSLWGRVCLNFMQIRCSIYDCKVARDGSVPALFVYWSLD
ncbi:unnamed protein product [Discosporangium mesarthrocarpum]